MGMMKREGITNYRTRLKLLKSSLPRLVVRKTDNQIISQIVEYAASGDRTLASVHSTELKKYGWPFNPKNIPSAYLSGVLLAKKSSVKEAVLDKGSHVLKKDSFIYYVVRGAQDGGLDLHATELPVSENRMFGEHIANYFGTGKGSQFSAIGDKVKNIRKEMENVIEKLGEHGK